jgi:hypothetical protein
MSNTRHEVMPFNIQNYELKKPLFFMNLTCLKYFIIVMKSWLIVADHPGGVPHT